MHDLIDIIRRNTRLQRPRRNVQHLARQPTHLAHALLLLLVEDGDVVPADELLLGPRDAIAGVVRVRDGAGDGARAGQRVDGAEGARVLEGGEGVEVAGGWIWFRDYLGWEEVGEEVTLFVDGFVLALFTISPSFLFSLVSTLFECF